MTDTVGKILLVLCALLAFSLMAWRVHVEVALWKQLRPFPIEVGKTRVILPGAPGEFIVVAHDGNTITIAPVQDVR